MVIITPKDFNSFKDINKYLKKCGVCIYLYICFLQLKRKKDVHLSQVRLNNRKNVVNISNVLGIPILTLKPLNQLIYLLIKITI